MGSWERSSKGTGQEEQHQQLASPCSWGQALSLRQPHIPRYTQVMTNSQHLPLHHLVSVPQT